MGGCSAASLQTRGHNYSDLDPATEEWRHARDLEPSPGSCYVTSDKLFNLSELTFLLGKLAINGWVNKTSRVSHIWDQWQNHATNPGSLMLSQDPSQTRWTLRGNLM